MGILRSFRVMVQLPRTLLLFTVTLTVVGTSLGCPHGQYLNENLQTCVNCSVCDNDKGLVVLRPCEVHRDVICTPINDLLSYINPDGHRRRHDHKHHQQKKQKEEIVWRYGDDVTSANSAERVGDSNTGGSELLDSVTSTEVPFNGTEALVWDWQAIALTLAVFACILFFLVITLYSLHQAKQWRRLKENFDADVEELSARLSLMAASSCEKGEILEPSLGPIHDGNYLNNRCVYLEQLLNVRKEHKIGSEGGNVYIQDSANNSTTTAANPKP